MTNGTRRKTSGAIRSKVRWWHFAILLPLTGLLLLFLIIMIAIHPAVGGRASGDRLERIRESPLFVDGQFRNLLPAESTGMSFKTIREYFTGGSDYRKPTTTITTATRSAADFGPVSNAPMRITWFGHSTLLVEMEGTRILVDPVWSGRLGPVTRFGNRRFYEPALPLEQLPDVDAVIISHDHYDHLDMPTVKALSGSVPQWIVPLGVGAHLEAWGVEPQIVTELEWWDEARAGSLRLVSTPARHFSGRSLTDRNATLWSGWALVGDEHRIWYSGDTAMTPEFKEIGERLGPFDITLIESGAYSEHWSDVHLRPEQAVLAHQLVQQGTGGVMVPVHWGLFDLALHGWTEPAERIIASATRAGIQTAFPVPGSSITPDDVPSERWWPDLPWRTADENPVVSTNLPDWLHSSLARP